MYMAVELTFPEGCKETHSKAGIETSTALFDIRLIP